MRDGHVVFDNVVHLHNLRDDNVIEPEGRLAQNFFYRLVRSMSEEGDYSDFAKEWTAEYVADRLFGDGSQIDFAMVQTVPMFDLYKDGLDAVERQYELVQAEPDRVVFCGGTDPMLRGLNTALHDIDHQIKNLGAKSIKFYTAHTRGRSWRMDDRRVAYPMYERMLEHGVNLAQVHKGNPLGPEPLQALQAHDVADAALDFPEMNFIIHHLGVPYEDETITIAARHPNIYLSMSTWINLIRVAPRLTAERIGKALAGVGADHVLWGSEAPLGPHPQDLLDWVWEFQMPDDLVEGYAYPRISDTDRADIFGGNLLRLLKLTVEYKEDGSPILVSSHD
jgi:predicted TIM-barrel fold metal-dependent hydrolase